MGVTQSVTESYNNTDRSGGRGRVPCQLRLAVEKTNQEPIHITMSLQYCH